MDGERASILWRCQELTDRERMLLLAYLCGRHPELVSRALDEHEAAVGPVHRPRMIADWPDEKDL